MNRFFFAVVTLFFVASTAFSQNKKDILLTIDDRPILASEFKRVYKKNLDLVQEESQKTVDGYLQLFVDYKLKVAEAYEQGFHESNTYKKDFAKYEEQLSRNYIYEEKVTSELAREAYERGLEEIEASHILIRVTYEAVPQDTLAAYEKINAIRDRAIAGEDFATLAKETSEEPNIEKTAGNLGYFTAFSLVYPFESGAYATAVGDVSEIVRTQFGYHIIKVHDRRAKLPEITVSHIMVSVRDTTQSFDPKERINEIYALLQQGESFESLAKQYSDDKNSGKQGGKLKKFSKGDLRSNRFEDASYELEKPGDISKPVRSSFGWHIIRLEEKHPIPPYEEKRAMLERRVKEGSRSKIVTNAVKKKIKEKFGFQKHDSYLPFFDTYVTDSVLVRKWKMDTLLPQQNKKLFTIANTKDVYFSDFAGYIEQRQLKSKLYKNKVVLLADYFDEFETQELKVFFRKKLEAENADYAAIISEYRDGLLIFDVMGKNVWRKAKKDSTGQLAFFEKNRSNYMWKERADVSILGATKESVIQEVNDMLRAGKSPKEIKEALNSVKEVNVLLTEGVFETDRRELPQGFVAEKGISKIYLENDSFIIVVVRDVMVPSPKEFEQTKGKVISDYQAYVEETWMNELRNKFKVDINQKTLKRIKKELKS
ncbi:MAG: peptidylprolyl isomerase [Bacteroidota bacterium]